MNLTTRVLQDPYSLERVVVSSAIPTPTERVLQDPYWLESGEPYHSYSDGAGLTGPKLVIKSAEPYHSYSHEAGLAGPILVNEW